MERSYTVSGASAASRGRRPHRSTASPTPSPSLSARFDGRVQPDGELPAVEQPVQVGVRVVGVNFLDGLTVWDRAWTEVKNA